MKLMTKMVLILIFFLMAFSMMTYALWKREQSTFIERFNGRTTDGIHRLSDRRVQGDG